MRSFSGHGDVVSGVAYLPVLDCYITGSWDRQLRLWLRPRTVQDASAAMLAVSDSSGDEDVGEGREVTSEYERQHPLIAPKALGQARDCVHTTILGWMLENLPLTLACLDCITA